MNKPAILASIVAATALGFGAWQSIARRDAEAALAASRREQDTARNELRLAKKQFEAVNERVVKAELQTASLKEDLGRLFAKNPAAAPGLPASGAAQTGFRAAPPRRTSPLVQRTTPTLRALDTTYHALYRQLNLSPAQIERFKAALTAATARYEELGRRAKQHGIGPRDPEIQPLFAQADADFRRALTDGFGPHALPALERFTETLFLRDAIAQWSLDLFYTDTPVTERQANELVEVMGKNMRDPAGRLDPAFADGPAMIAEAELLLSPAQQPRWREFIDDLRKSSFASLLRPPRR